MKRNSGWENEAQNDKEKLKIMQDLFMCIKKMDVLICVQVHEQVDFCVMNVSNGDQ